jgi:hypothetical protein
LAAYTSAIATLEDVFCTSKESSYLLLASEHPKKHELQIMAPPLAAEEQGIIERLIAQDDVRWWNKPNLRRLYLFLVPFCLFIESTSGFDSSMSM